MKQGSLDSMVTSRTEDDDIRLGINKEYSRDVDVVGLFRELKDIASAREEADRLMIEFASTDEKAREILNTPQSSDKHAEGPLVEDHYREILTAIALLRDGKLTFEKACEFLPILELKNQWDEVVDVIKKHPNLLIAFAFGHDIAKSDTIGFVGGTEEAVRAGIASKEDHKTFDKKKKPAKDAAETGDETLLAAFRIERLERQRTMTEVYTKLYQEFMDQTPELSSLDRQKVFFEKYKISISYYGHAEDAYEGANVQKMDAWSEKLGLTVEERALLRFAIKQHINPLIKFTVSDPKFVHAFVLAAQGEGVDPKTAIRVLQAGLLVDGVFGTRKLKESDPVARISDPMPLINFWNAEKTYPEFAHKETERLAALETQQVEKERRDVILKEVGLNGDSLKSLGLPEGPLLGNVLGAVNRAIRLGEGLQNVPENIREILEERIKRAIEKIRATA